MAANSSLVHFGAIGTVHVAAVGTAAPTDATTALAAAWKDVGWISEDGVGLNDTSEDGSEFKGWGGIIRTVAGSVSKEISFSCLETSQLVWELYFGSTNVGVSPVVKFDIPAAGASVQKALCINTSETINATLYPIRFYFPTVEITSRGELRLNSDDAIAYEMTFKALGTGSLGSVFGVVAAMAG